MTYINLEPDHGQSYSARIARPNGLSEYRLPKVSRRRFDDKLCVWVKDLPPLRAQNRGPRAKSALPIGDGSGVFWEIFDKITGNRLWIIEAFDHSVLSDELTFLCKMARYSTSDLGFKQKI